MSQVNINIRIDENLKKDFDKFCGDVGMTTTTAFCLFAKTVVREQKIPFEITAISSEKDPFFSEVNIQRLYKSMKQIEEIGGTIHDIDEVICND